MGCHILQRNVGRLGCKDVAVVESLDIPEPQVEHKPNFGDPENASLQSQRFMLQAGSFRKAEDAERRKAELAFLGLESSISLADVSGQTYHRVELGPFIDGGSLSRTKNQLIANDISFIAKSVQ